QTDDVIADERDVTGAAEHFDKDTRIGLRAACDDAAPQAADPRPSLIPHYDELARLFVRDDGRDEMQPIGKADVAARGQLLPQRTTRGRLLRIRRVGAHLAAHLEVHVAERVHLCDRAV